MVMLMKGVSGRHVMQGATGFRINHLEVRKPCFAAKLGATEQAKFARDRMMSATKCNPTEVFTECGFAVVRSVVEAAHPTSGKADDRENDRWQN